MPLYYKQTYNVCVTYNIDKACVITLYILVVTKENNDLGNCRLVLKIWFTLSMSVVSYMSFSSHLQVSYQLMVRQAHRQVAQAVAAYGSRQMAFMGLVSYKPMVVQVGT